MLLRYDPHAKRNKYVYVIDDEFGVPCYVGAGCSNRLNHHVMAALGKKKPPNAESAKHLYLVDCIKRGYLPVAYKVADDLTNEEAMAYEIILIGWYGRRDLGTGCLFNTCAGGFGLKNYSEKTRSLISQKTREAMADPAIRAHISKKGKERFASKESRDIVSANTYKQFATKGHPRTGKNNTPENCAKISVATKEAMARPEVRAKVITGLHEAMARPEVRVKLSANARNHWTPESRAKQALRMKEVNKKRWNAYRLAKQNSSEVGTPA